MFWNCSSLASYFNTLTFTELQIATLCIYEPCSNKFQSCEVKKFTSLTTAQSIRSSENATLLNLTVGGEHEPNVVFVAFLGDHPNKQLSVFYHWDREKWSASYLLFYFRKKKQLTTLSVFHHHTTATTWLNNETHQAAFPPKWQCCILQFRYLLPWYGDLEFVSLHAA